MITPTPKTQIRNRLAMTTGSLEDAIAGHWGSTRPSGCSQRGDERGPRQRREIADLLAKSKSRSEIIGEFLREVAVLLTVFAPLEALFSPAALRALCHGIPADLSSTGQASGFSRPARAPSTSLSSGERRHVKGALEWRYGGPD